MRSSRPCQIATGTVMEAGSKPQASQNARSSSTHPSALTRTAPRASAAM
jgi:hypothetical protein